MCRAFEFGVWGVAASCASTRGKAGSTILISGRSWIYNLQITGLNSTVCWDAIHYNRTGVLLHTTYSDFHIAVWIGDEPAGSGRSVTAS